MESSYSTIAVKYVGSPPAEQAIEALRELHADGSVTLIDAVAVTRSAGGEVNLYPIEKPAMMQSSLAMGFGGMLLGWALRRKLRCTWVGALIGFALGWLSFRLKREAIVADAPYVEKNESMLFMRIMDADWTAFWLGMKPYLTRGLMVLRTIAPNHPELEAQVVPDEERMTEPEAELVAESASETGDHRNDDFLAIHGIGRVYAGRLHASGVITYAQLAEMSVEQIADITGIPASRVTNHDWIGQAEELAAA